MTSGSELTSVIVIFWWHRARESQSVPSPYLRRVFLWHDIFCGHTPFSGRFPARSARSLSFLATPLVFRMGRLQGGNAHLLHAAKEDDIQALKKLFEEGEDVNASNVIGQTALHIAALWGNVDTLEFLLLSGADMDAQNQNGQTPLHFASAKGMFKCVQLLLGAGADPTLTTSGGRTPADDAANDRVLALLSPPLEVHDAVKNLDVSKVKELLATSDPGFERLDADGNTALHLAVVIAETEPAVSLELINVLCGLGDARVLGKVLTKRSAKTGSSPMHLACEKANASVVKALVDAGEMVGVGHATLNRRTVKVGGFNDGSWGKKDENGVVSGLDAEDATPLHVAIERLRRATDDENADASNGGRQEEIDACHSILKLLMESGADVDAIDGDGATALHHAVADDLVDVVELLLSKGASLHVGGKFIGTGNTTLHYAVRLGDPQMVARILARAKDANLDVDAHGKGGWSPLGLAVRVGNTPVVDALLAAGARGDAVMGTGKTPLDIARVNNKLAIIETIEKNQKSA